MQSSPTLLPAVALRLSKGAVRLQMQGRWGAHPRPLCSASGTPAAAPVRSGHALCGRSSGRGTWRELHAAAQFNSVWKALDQNQRVELEKEAKKQKTKLSEKGLADAPAVFKPKTKLPKYLDALESRGPCSRWRLGEGPDRA